MSIITTKRENPLSYMNILVLILSVYVLTALIVDLVVDLPQEVHRILHFIDNGICVIFLIDFSIRFYHAESKLKFMKWGWIDLLASIPAIDYLRLGRGVRLIRLLRILRAIRSVRLLANHMFHNKVQGVFSTATIITVLTVIFSAIAILEVERGPEAQIRTAEDALLWAYSTVTSISFDKQPVTTEGRILTGLLKITGIALVGIFTGFLASWFVQERKAEEEADKAQ